MTVRLLDVNLLISLLDGAHVHHTTAVRWFEGTAATGWATCPITENGFIRVVSHVAYPNFRFTPATAARSLSRFKENFAGVHQAWPDDVALTDSSLFDLSALTGSKQLTDCYLAGLAFRHSGIFATLDSSIPWKAVRGASGDLVERVVANRSH